MGAVKWAAWLRIAATRAAGGDDGTLLPRGSGRLTDGEAAHVAALFADGTPSRRRPGDKHLRDDRRPD